MARPYVLPIFVAACLGVLYACIAINFWSVYAANNPVSVWLINALSANGHEMAYRVAIGIHDMIVNIVAAAPFAAVLLIRSSLNNWTCAAVAGAAAVVFGYWDTNWSVSLLTSMGFWFGLAMTLLSLPIAFAGFRAIRIQSQAV